MIFILRKTQAAFLLKTILDTSKEQRDKLRDNALEKRDKFREKSLEQREKLREKSIEQREKLREKSLEQQEKLREKRREIRERAVRENWYTIPNAISFGRIVIGKQLIEDRFQCKF